MATGDADVARKLAATRVQELELRATVPKTD
jgi:hypothetical protein